MPSPRMRKDVPSCVPAGMWYFVVPPERRHVDFAAQRRLREGNRHIAIQVVAVALEESCAAAPCEVMYRSPAGPPLRPGSPSPRNGLEILPVVHACRNVERHGARHAGEAPVPEHLLHLGSLMILPCAAAGRARAHRLHLGRTGCSASTRTLAGAVGRSGRSAGCVPWLRARTALQASHSLVAALQVNFLCRQPKAASSKVMRQVIAADRCRAAGAFWLAAAAAAAAETAAGEHIESISSNAAETAKAASKPPRRPWWGR